MTPALAALVAGMPTKPIADSTAFVEAGRRLNIQWPADYAAVLAEHDGVEGDVGEFRLVLEPPRA